MIKKMYFLSFMLLACFSAFGQITLDDCYDKARANYPLIKRYDLIEKAQEYSLSNVSKMWLPQFSLSAKATYQSDVTKIPIDFSQIPIPQLAAITIPSLSKDQYAVSLELDQTIWDGGITKAKREEIRAKNAADKQDVEVNLYALRDRVDQIYFGVLLCDAMLEQNRLFQNQLQINYDRIGKLVKGGLANQSDLDAIHVGQLKAKQGETQIMHGRKTYLDMLSAFIGQKLDDSIVLEKPSGIQNLDMEIKRPELSLFDANLASLNAMKKEVNSSLMPKIGFFVVGGYGKPALNMLKNEFSTYYIGGVRLAWNISSFYTHKNSLALLKTNYDNIEVMRETFLFNNELGQKAKSNEIEKYKDLLKSDDEIVGLHTSIRKSAEAQVQNGTMSVTDLMQKSNEEQSARQDRAVHEIQMLQAIYNLKFITNN